MARKIAIAIHKGGVGKTTTAKNLAAAFAARGKRTLLVDLDQQANATKGLGFDPTLLSATLNDLFADPNRDAAGVVVATGIDNLHLLPAHPDLGNTESGMAYLRATDPAASDPIQQLKAILAPLDQAYDLMLLDTPPSLGYMTVNALAAADEILIPAAAFAYSVDGVRRTWAAYELASRTYNPSLKAPRILVTRLKHTNASREVLEEIRHSYAAHVLAGVIPESTSVDEAEQWSQTVVFYDPRSAAAQAYKGVVEELTRE